MSSNVDFERVDQLGQTQSRRNSAPLNDEATEKRDSTKKTMSQKDSEYTMIESSKKDIYEETAVANV